MCDYYCSRKWGPPICGAIIWQRSQTFGESVCELFVPRSSSQPGGLQSVHIGDWMAIQAWSLFFPSLGSIAFFHMPSSFMSPRSSKYLMNQLPHCSKPELFQRKFLNGGAQWGCLTHVLTQSYPMEFEHLCTRLWERIQGHLSCKQQDWNVTGEWKL